MRTLCLLLLSLSMLIVHAQYQYLNTGIPTDSLYKKLKVKTVKETRPNHTVTYYKAYDTLGRLLGTYDEEKKKWIDRYVYKTVNDTFFTFNYNDNFSKLYRFYRYTKHAAGTMNKIVTASRDGTPHWLQKSVSLTYYNQAGQTYKSIDLSKSEWLDDKDTMVLAEEGLDTTDITYYTYFDSAGARYNIAKHYRRNSLYQTDTSVYNHGKLIKESRFHSYSPSSYLTFIVYYSYHHNKIRSIWYIIPSPADKEMHEKMFGQTGNGGEDETEFKHGLKTNTYHFDNGKRALASTTVYTYYK